MSDKKYWVGFNLVKGIGAVRLQALRDHFGDLAVAWQSPLDALQAAGLSPRLADRVAQIRASVDLDKYLDQISIQNINVLTWDDESCPVRLKEIDQPPPVLYVRGELIPEDSWAVSVVGTRRISAYGRQVTEDLAGRDENYIAVREEQAEYEV
jgi:DNA processing protein